MICDQLYARTASRSSATRAPVLHKGDWTPPPPRVSRMKAGRRRRFFLFPDEERRADGPRPTTPPAYFDLEPGSDQGRGTCAARRIVLAPRGDGIPRRGGPSTRSLPGQHEDRTSATTTCWRRPTASARSGSWSRNISRIKKRPATRRSLPEADLTASTDRGCTPTMVRCFSGGTNNLPSTRRQNGQLSEACLKLHRRNSCGTPKGFWRDITNPLVNSYKRPRAGATKRQPTSRGRRRTGGPLVRVPGRHGGTSTRNRAAHAGSVRAIRIWLWP